MMSDLPRGWRSVELIDAVDLIMDYRGRTPKKLGLDWGGGDIPAISARNVRMGYIDFSVEHYLGSESLYRRWMSRGDMHRGDILFTTEAPLGNAAPVPDDRRYILSQRTVLMRPASGKYDALFFTKFLQSPEFQQVLLDNATGSTALGIQRRRLERLSIITPPVEEQVRIGLAVDDADKLILSLEGVIAKKRAIKQGMMQELLTGRTRLPGFAGEWDTTLLGSILKVRNGRSQRGVEVTGGRYPILATGGEIGRTDTPIYTKPSVLIGRKGTIDRPQFRESPFWTVDTLFYTEISPRADARFVYYLCTTIDWMALNEATGVPSLTGTRIESVEVVLPRPEEQQAISAVLDDAEAEIAALERRLEGTRAIKQGMMQELLTGRTRLVRAEVGA